MSQRPDLTLISPAIRDAMEHWLSHERALKSAADNTLSAYATDVAGFTAFMAQHRGGRTFERTVYSRSRYTSS